MKSSKENKVEQNISIDVFTTPIGKLEIAARNGKIVRVCLVDYEYERKIDNKDPNKTIIERARCQLKEYFDGKRKEFDLDIDFIGTNFQRKVWKELLEIPYGETRSYKDIAIAIGNENATRAVGGANNKNPIIIIAPCHRVIGKNGDMVGFGCGIEVKKYLLNLEQKN